MMSALDVTMMILIPLAIAAVLGFVAFSVRLGDTQRRWVERALALGGLILFVGMSGWLLKLAIEQQDWFTIAAVVVGFVVVGIELAKKVRRASTRRRTGA
jgi:hypothetical protein